MRILCFGDSNTYGYDPRSYFGGRYPAEDRWVDILAQKTGYDIVNEGENGREIPHRTYELSGFRLILSENQPIDLLIIMLGSNDLLQGAKPTEIAACMEKFLNQIPLNRDQIMLIAPPPMKRGEWVTDDQLIIASTELTEHFRPLTQRLGVRFADAGCWDIDLTFDGVHFSETGHRAFAEGLFDVFTALG